LFFGVVDVRDVADLHLRAMIEPAAAGQRFIAVSSDEVVSMFDIAKALRQRLGPRARRVPTRQIPNWVVRLVARFNPEMRTLLPLLGKKRHATSAKAQRLLGWQPRPWNDAVVASAESLLAFGVVR
jgi:dihydroflavonol-4-reductase